MYKGCSVPLLADKLHTGDYHSKDGLGDVPDLDVPGLELLQKKKTVAALIKMIKQNPGEVHPGPFYMTIKWSQVFTIDADLWSWTVFRWLLWPQLPSPTWLSQYSWLLPCPRSWKPFTSWEATLTVCLPAGLACYSISLNLCTQCLILKDWCSHNKG